MRIQHNILVHISHQARAQGGGYGASAPTPFTKKGGQVVPCTHNKVTLAQATAPLNPQKPTETPLKTDKFKQNPGASPRF